MKFPKKLHSELIQAISSKGFEETEFTFVKRRGRIITMKRSGKNSFSFFLKKSMEINKLDGSFVERELYLVSVNKGEEYELEKWEDVKNQYLKWLSEMAG